MTALRRTQPGDRAPGRTWVRATLLLFSIGLLGCGATVPPDQDQSPQAAGTNDPAWMMKRPALPPPDTDRINYDERTRTLTLYNLPGNDRWLVQLPGESRAQQVPPKHRLPADVDTSEVMVSYARPGLKPSAPVSVKQIQDSGGAHVSIAEH